MADSVQWLSQSDYITKQTKQTDTCCYDNSFAVSPVFI